MGVIIGSREENLPGIEVVSWLQDRELRLDPEDRRPRRATAVHSIVLHTTKGIPGGTNLTPQRVLPGFGPSTSAGDRTVNFWSHDGRGAGAHPVVDQDGSVYCCADLLTEAAYHAGPINEWSIGIEIFQAADGSLFAGALERTVLLVDALTLRFSGTQRQIPRRYGGQASPRLLKDPGSWVGVLGHRDVSDNRGRGDPGDAIFDLLAAAGYERFDPDKNEDTDTWKERQAQLGIPADGMPGPQTRQALMRASLGRGNGLWVVRPIDSLASSPPG